MPSSGARVRACKPRPPWPTMAERLVSSGEERPPASSPARRLVASDQRTRERRGGGATYADGRDGRKVAVGEMRPPPESRLAESRAPWRLDAEAEAGSWRPVARTLGSSPGAPPPSRTPNTTYNYNRTTCGDVTRRAVRGCARACRRCRQSSPSPRLCRWPTGQTPFASSASSIARTLMRPILPPRVDARELETRVGTLPSDILDRSTRRFHQCRRPTRSHDEALARRRRRCGADQRGEVRPPRA